MDEQKLAGILEVKGWIGRRFYKGKRTPIISLTSTDPSLLLDITAKFGGKIRGPYGPYGANKERNAKPHYTLERWGTWMEKLAERIGPHLSESRLAELREISQATPAAAKRACPDCEARERGELGHLKQIGTTDDWRCKGCGCKA